MGTHHAEVAYQQGEHGRREGIDDQDRRRNHPKHRSISLDAKERQNAGYDAFMFAVLGSALAVVFTTLATR